MSAQKELTMETLPAKSNVQYKDSMFSLYFRDPARLIDMYNALKGTNYPPDTPLEINTLTGVFYKNRINDVSFVIDGKFVVLVEHQSTLNKNMPLRCLIYLGRLYEKLLEKENIYKETLVNLDAPEFYVVYTGTKPLPDVSILKLSDAFRAIPSDNSVELIVKVVNAWYTEDKEILRQSRTLREYSLFLYKVKEYLDMGMPLSEAIHKAILYCADHDIMKDFLLENASEVENMLFSEWDMETALRVRKEEGRLEGRKEGRLEGREEGRLEAIKSLVYSLPCSAEKAMDLLSIPTSERPHYMQMLTK